MSLEAPPDIGAAGSVDDVVDGLRRLKIWAGDPSYEAIKERVNAALPRPELVGKNTVADCFRPGRRRLNPELVVAIVRALHADVGYAAQWRQTLRVIAGQADAATQVRVQDGLPQDLPGFTGRAAELGRLRADLRRGAADGAPVVISAIAGMAGVGKTRLAVRAAHLLDREQSFDRILFVNLRGFHPDPAQPPAQPAAVLDGFLRLLGVPGQRIPHGLRARAAAFREHLAGTRTLIVLDNAADADQVRPLLPGTAGCPVLVTSRRDLRGLHGARHLTVGVFGPDEAAELLARAAPGVPMGGDPDALGRIAARCGRLPLALGLVAAHLRDRPGWTLTDHADRLDERHRDRHLDPGVHLALDLSYQRLADGSRRLLRLVGLHPGQDFDAHAAAALTGAGVARARDTLRDLTRDHLVQQVGPDRWTLHDLVRAHAGLRAADEEPPAGRRAALGRLFDFYLATAAAAVNLLYPAESDRLPRLPSPGTPLPDTATPEAARAWLDLEHSTLLGVSGYTAGNGLPAHTVNLSRIMFRHLSGGHLTDSLAIHGNAVRAARRAGDPAGEARALECLGVSAMRQGRLGEAAEHIGRAIELYRRCGDRTGEAVALNALAEAEVRMDRFATAAVRLRRALRYFRGTGRRLDEANVLDSLGKLYLRKGDTARAAPHYLRALAIFREIDDPEGTACALTGLGDIANAVGQSGRAVVRFDEALRAAARIGNRFRLAHAHAGLGHAHRALARPADARRHFRRALTLYTDLGMPEADQIEMVLGQVR
ncbi:tetratricopeptide repeat protein [Actinoplanes sp. NPDC051861]|uniref:tetratricopeptide repeat protein n=1 Tax=Actinoplanes sp. NPDC051861 TaxID=3155170 RepID=UPI00344727FD